jgi:nucleoside-diphosphate-sugar epimerase
MPNCPPLSETWFETEEMGSVKNSIAVPVPSQIAVVGGAGEVGKIMVRVLAHAPGCEKVRVIDARPPPEGTFIQDGPTEIEYVKHALGSDCSESLAAALADMQCVFCMVTPGLLTATTEEFFRTNVVGVKALLAACEQARVRRLVFLSSIAVTGHESSSSNASEKDPLPALAEYTSPYDQTKRLGEEAVLAADREGGLRTCALRGGGLLSSARDYIFTSACVMPGVVYTVERSRPIDMMDSRDMCRALLLAARALEEKPAEVAGQAFFVTKGEAVLVEQIAAMIAESLGRQVVMLPRPIHECIRVASFFPYALKRMLGLRVAGVPTHRFWTYAHHEQTFDNSKVQRVLGFTPEYSVKDAIVRIMSEYRCAQTTAQTQTSSMLSFIGLGAMTAVAVTVAGLYCAQPNGLLTKLRIRTCP